MTYFHILEAEPYLLIKQTLYKQNIAPLPKQKKCKYFSKNNLFFRQRHREIRTMGMLTENYFLHFFYLFRIF